MRDGGREEKKGLEGNEEGGIKAQREEERSGAADVSLSQFGSVGSLFLCQSGLLVRRFVPRNKIRKKKKWRGRSN